MNRLTTPQGTFELARFPEHPRDPFQAWDAADTYLLQELADPETGPVDLSGTVAVVGDRWGALATALAAHRPVQIGDSYLGARHARQPRPQRARPRRGGSAVLP